MGNNILNGLNKLVITQFMIYAVVCILGFIVWMLAFTNNVTILEIFIGEYFYGHIIRWTATFPFWGILALISAILSLGAIYFLRRLRKEGAYLGIVSFCLGFATNILFARNILVHTLVGMVIGWTLLAPLVVEWKLLIKENARKV